MKKSRYELVQRPGLPPLVRKRHYPRYVFEVKPGEAIPIKHKTYDVVVVDDPDGAGPPSATYLRDVAQEWHYLDYDLKDPAPLEKPEAAELFELLNGAYVARECFGRSRAWFYQRLNGNVVNGEPARFTEEQKTQLADYLLVVAQRIVKQAEELKTT